MVPTDYPKLLTQFIPHILTYLLLLHNKHVKTPSTKTQKKLSSKYCRLPDFRCIFLQITHSLAVQSVTWHFLHSVKSGFIIDLFHGPAPSEEVFAGVLWLLQDMQRSIGRVFKAQLLLDQVTKCLRAFQKPFQCCQNDGWNTFCVKVLFLGEKLRQADHWMMQRVSTGVVSESCGKNEFLNTNLKNAFNSKQVFMSNSQEFRMSFYTTLSLPAKRRVNTMYQEPSMSASPLYFNVTRCVPPDILFGFELALTSWSSIWQR